jgi:uncharacterized membrane protein YjjP (DUF1212 family)
LNKVAVSQSYIILKESEVIDMTNLTEIESISKKFDNDIEQISKELKRIQSIK